MLMIREPCHVLAAVPAFLPKDACKIPNKDALFPETVRKYVVMLCSLLFRVVELYILFVRTRLLAFTPYLCIQ